MTLFQSIRDAQAARRALDGDTIGRESNRKCKIGFGKAQPSKKLWVGDLGPWATASMLEKEFDRYGPIEDLDYKEGDEFAYVTYVSCVISLLYVAYLDLPIIKLQRMHSRVCRILY